MLPDPRCCREHTIPYVVFLPTMNKLDGCNHEESRDKLMNSIKERAYNLQKHHRHETRRETAVH